MSCRWLLRSSLASALALAGVLAMALAGLACGDQKSRERSLMATGQAATNETAAVRGKARTIGEVFADVTAQSGVDFYHFNGMSGALYYVESVGPGLALFDFDHDGDLDLYFGQGHMLGPGKLLSDALVPPVMPAPLRDRLYRNDLGPGGALRFVDVTEASGISGDGYAMGMATGDVDNDGWTDLYVSNFGNNRLWHNRGDGSFQDVTTAAGVDDSRWTASAAFFDYDRDGWLDLFVTGYVAFRYENHRPCRNASGRPDYCGPENYRCLTDRLFHNRGDGSFEDVSGTAGILGACGRGLGVVSADFDADGWVDLYVANDQDRNHFWHNRGDGSFENDALIRGAAVSGEGRAEASMGVVAGDLDEDGDPDLFLSHLRTETNTAYRNDGSAFFEDVSNEWHLAAPSLPWTGFGVALVDADNDGWLDLGVMNGSVSIIEAQARAGEPLPLRQPNQLFHNTGGGFFALLEGVRASSAFATAEVSRGVAVGDLDNDGAQDLVITNNNGRARVLRNVAGAGRRFLGLRLLAPNGRDLLGAEVEVALTSGQVRHRRVGTDGSFLSAGDPRIVVGLGADDGVERVLVRWPDGSEEVFTALAIGRYHELIEGWGVAREPVAAGR